MNIKINLNGTSSKDEEIAVLTQITDSLRGSGSYLESLLNDKMLEFAVFKIRSDFPPDLFGELESTIAERDEFHKERFTAQTEVKRQAEEIANLTRVQGNLRDNYNSLSEARDRLYSEKEQLKAEVDNLNDKLLSTQEEIINIKAKLYDLTCK